VFALAQGIPAVCLTKSSYYQAKFRGLQDLFNVGCTIIGLHEPDMPAELSAAMEDAWNAADAVRPFLLQSASGQIEESRRAYQECKSITCADPKAAAECQQMNQITTDIASGKDR
jgi:colanic acid/amylovoran biosynthesis protein